MENNKEIYYHPKTYRKRGNQHGTKGPWWECCHNKNKEALGCTHRPYEEEEKKKKKEEYVSLAKQHAVETISNEFMIS